MRAFNFSLPLFHPTTFGSAKIGNNRVQIVQRFGCAVASNATESVYQKGGFELAVIFSPAGISSVGNIPELQPDADANNEYEQDFTGLSPTVIQALLKVYGSGLNRTHADSFPESWTRDDHRIISMYLDRQNSKGLAIKEVRNEDCKSLQFANVQFPDRDCVAVAFC